MTGTLCGYQGTFGIDGASAGCHDDLIWLLHPQGALDKVDEHIGSKIVLHIVGALLGSRVHLNTDTPTWHQCIPHMAGTPI